MNATLETPTLFALGDWVKLVHFPHHVARIVELRGALGPNGDQVYGLHIKNGRGKPLYVELLENQFEKTDQPVS